MQGHARRSCRDIGDAWVGSGCTGVAVKQQKQAMNQDTATSFMRNLFLPVQHSKVYVTQLPYGNNSLTDANLPNVHGDIRTGSWFFGVCPRDRNGAVTGVSNVWTDLDKVTVPPDEIFIAPPSAMVMSGHGLHIYHVLSELVQVEYGVRLTKLAALAFNGDTAVCEPQRIMRLPGSVNVKYQTDPKECYVINSSWDQYSPQDIEERLFAATVAKHWVDGQRHQLSLAIGALLSRADWDLERAERVIEHLCDFKRDTERVDRLYAVRGTYNRRLNGDLVSSALLRDLLDKDFKRLVECLGIRSRDGDLLYKDEVFGKLVTVTKNLVTLVINNVTGWSWAEGVPVKWKGDHWHHYDDDVLRRDIFDVFSDVKVIQANEEVEFNPRVGDASAVMQIFKGHCKINELGDPREDIVPVINCVVEIPSMRTRPHEQSDFNRFVLPVTYDPDAKCPTWERFLMEAVNGDMTMYAFLQEWVGYCLRLGNPRQKMLWIQGKSGTGKSTFLKTIYAMFGQAAVPITPNDLNDQVIAAICHAHVAVCSEISRRQLQTRRINEMVTGDVIKGRFLYGRQFDARFRGKIMWASNSFPPVDEGEGLWRRLITVPFEVQPKVEDAYLPNKLLEELSGILNWALEGLKRVIDYDKAGYWPVPQSAIELLIAYRESAELMEQFRDDCLEMGPMFTSVVDEVYMLYKTWAETHGHRPLACDATWLNEMRRIGMSRGSEPLRLKNGGSKRTFKGGKLREFVFDTIRRDNP